MNGIIIQTEDLGSRPSCYPDEVTFITHSVSTCFSVADSLCGGSKGRDVFTVIQRHLTFKLPLVRGSFLDIIVSHKHHKSQ